MSKITLLVEFAIKDGELGSYRDASTEMRAAVQEDEPGTIQYDWWLSSDGTRGFNIEAFRDSDALATHMANSAALVGDLIAAADVVRVEVFGELTKAGHASIEGAATGYFSSLGGITR